MSNMQAFYKNVVEASGKMGTANAARSSCMATAVSDDLVYQQTLLRLTQITVAELRAVKSELAWQPWWKDEDGVSENVQ